MGMCVVLTGLEFNNDSFPTLKCGANSHRASGAQSCPINQQDSSMPGYMVNRIAIFIEFVNVFFTSRSRIVYASRKSPCSEIFT
jgi:hypothetical protein